MNNPYVKYVSEYASILKKGRRMPLGGFSHAGHSAIPENAPKALLLSPHPDDECITGALPLRLLREGKIRVINVAVTLGSRKDRQLERLEELRHACDYLGFDLLPASERGLEGVNAKTRDNDKNKWAANVAVVADIIKAHRPEFVFFPHASDWNGTHVGVHLLATDALKTMPESFCCRVVQTEFWAPLPNPNVMVESSVADAADLVASISFHAGEVARNPYHLRLPAWMQDNVRRGGELVGGQGCEAPDFTFATLYRIAKWLHGREEAAEAPGLFLSCNDSPEKLAG